MKIYMRYVGRERGVRGMRKEGLGERGMEE
jgi:hypothetical protein